MNLNFYSIQPFQLSQIMSENEKSKNCNWFDLLITTKMFFERNDSESKNLKGYIQHFSRDTFGIYMFTEKGI